MQERGRAFVEQFLAKLSLLLRGTTTAPSARFGESLQDEHAKCGSFASSSVGGSGAPAPVSPDLPNASLRLYGGAQYNRAMAEFRRAPCTSCRHHLPGPDHTLEPLEDVAAVTDTPASLQCNAAPPPPPQQ